MCQLLSFNSQCLRETWTKNQKKKKTRQKKTPNQNPKKLQHNKQEKQQEPHQWESASAGVDFPGKSVRELELKSVSGDKKKQRLKK